MKQSWNKEKKNICKIKKQEKTGKDILNRKKLKIN